jgi:hypothetical protein
MVELITMWISDDVMKAPNFMHQAPENLQASSFKACGGRRAAWNLVLLWSLVLGAWCFSAHAQTPLSNLVVTVGTTIRDSSNQEWSYVLVRSVDDAVLQGRRFAVFGKPGQPGSPNAFTQRGTMQQHTDVTIINNLLNQSVALGQDRLSLSNALNLMFRSSPGITNQSLAQKIVSVFNRAASDPDTREFLPLIGAGHPGFNLALGRAFSEQVNSVTTYEIRELDAAGAPGDVVGRVTVTPGVPLVLPAPGRPFQVMTNDQSDHLRVRLRWGTALDLRRLAPLQYGFNVWRISRAAAEAGSFHVTPPTPAQLVSNPNFVRASAAPVVTPTELDLGSSFGGAEYLPDRVTHFFADTGRTTGTTFSDGQEFYYFVTARDVLGRDGFVSPGGLARACRRMAPKPPTEVTVENVVLPGTTNQPRLRVNWEQNNNATDAITHYWIYRWTNPTAALTNDAAPLVGRIGIVPHQAGTNANSFLDNTTGALTNANVSNVWYTVRAVSEAACDPLLSPHAGPAWGVLRERAGPLATTGEVVGSCGLPVVMFQNFATNLTANSTQRWSFTLTVQRRDPGIEWAVFVITDWDSWTPPRTNTTTIGPLYFPPDGDVLHYEYDPPPDTMFTHTQRVACAVGTMDGLISAPATVTMPFASTSAPPREVVFLAGQLLTTALSGNDPLLATLNAGFTQCIEPYSVVPDASGMVALKFDFNGAPSALIQAWSNNVWLDVAMVTPDTNLVYWVSYPACLVGPVPPFRACRVNLPPQGTNCDQHISAAAAAGPTAPLRVRFRLTPRTREYRVYRRVDNGPMTFVAQGAANYDPANPTKIIEAVDEAMPPSAARLCYFVQLLDEHGNGSPMAFVGCKFVRPAKMPRPVLAEPQALGDSLNPQVLLNWFCPTAGVARFQVKIHRVNPPDPATPGLASPKLSFFAAYNKSKIHAGLIAQSTKLFQFSEAFFTAPVGIGLLGAGPQFALEADVQPNVEYDISVAPVDERGVVADGSTSEVWRFVWRPPVVLADVPWPARSLPPVRAFDDLPVSGLTGAYRPRAVLMRNFNQAHDFRYPVGVTIGDFTRMAEITGDYNQYYPNVGTTNFYGYRFFIAPAQDPNDLFVFRRNSNDPARHGQSLLPIVLYRQQVTNVHFPRVSGTVIQVSPLIERLPWAFTNATFQSSIPDRLIGNSVELVNNQFVQFLCVRDLQPVRHGAKYRYFVARFNAKRELEEIIPAGEVELPAND